ncbi:hypothetical protein C8T65DRAFT_544474, partial [Cerioporus squamosus]
RHLRYYFDDGNLFLMVDDVLFCIHRSVFLATATLFHEHVPSWLGWSEDQPVHLRDVKATKFSKFLSFIYPLVAAEEAFSTEDWIAMLEQSQKWGCSGIRAVAIAELEKTSMDDALRIATWKKFALDESQLARCYHTFGTRSQPISTAEGQLMGMEMALRLSALRDSVNQG